MATNDSYWQGIFIDDCKWDTCPHDLAYQDYRPSVPGNALYVAIFAILLGAQTFLGIRYKTWGFLVGMFGGLVLELVGYVGRILLHNNPFSRDAFLTSLICLTIAPAFLSASIYLSLSRIVVIYGEHISRVRPRTYTILFICCDIFSLVLQAIGGGLTAQSDNGSSAQTSGINIMIAGLAMQTASLALFYFLCAEYAVRVSKRRSERNPEHEALRNTTKFKAFLWGLAIATVAILIRSAYRVGELSQGFDGSLANQEAPLMILDGAMVIIACTLLTVLHPGITFQGAWHDVNFHLRGGRSGSGRMEKGESVSPPTGLTQETK